MGVRKPVSIPAGCGPEGDHASGPLADPSCGKEAREMERLTLCSSKWYQALTLGERFIALQATPERQADRVDMARARRRLGRWRAQAPFAEDDNFTVRLAQDGLSEGAMLELLGEPMAAVRERVAVTPAWLVDLADCYASFSWCSSRLFPEPFRASETTGFLNLIAPLINRAMDRLAQQLEELSHASADLPFDPATVITLLATNLPGRLLSMLSRTMALELNIARLQGHLAGSTPEERFRDFVTQLADREFALSLLAEYPVLARQVVASLDCWVEVKHSLIRRLVDDWDALCATFSPAQAPGIVVEVADGAGDSHRGGQSVHILRFSSGLRVVYKPRAMSVDSHFQDLLVWLNDHGIVPPLRTVKILDRGDYGWEEFVSPSTCTDGAQVTRFYQRQGSYLALLYALAATDFHFENLVAAGEHPVLVDLEALFHRHVQTLDLRVAENQAGSRFIGSVVTSGLLPMRVWSNASSEGVDISGLGAAGGQLTPHGVLAWDGAGTDEMRLTRTRTTIPEGRNRPALNGAPVDLLDYVEDILSGFASTYWLIWQHRDELLAPTGPLACFAGDETRVILRGTQSYAMLLQESYHPDMLRDALERDRLLDRLWEAVSALPHLARVISAERAALLMGDIPVFLAKPGSHHLGTGTGQCLPDFFVETGLDLVRRRLQELSERDFKQQHWFIRASLATISPSIEARFETRQACSEGQGAPNCNAFLAAARAIADRLAALVLRGTEGVSWIGLTFHDELQPNLGVLGSDLYEGLTGIAFYLGYLAATVGDTGYRELAEETLRTAQAQVQRDANPDASIGGFSGLGGFIYALTHLGTLWEHPALYEQAAALAERVSARANQVDEFDIVRGAAGSIGALLSLYRCAPSGHTLEAAVRCGERLLALAQPMTHGIAWPYKMGASQPLTGFSHGTAGAAWSLLELAAVTGEGRFHEAALSAMAYERSVFCPEKGNWPDFRLPFGKITAFSEPEPMVTWCHGAPGIGLARLRSLRHVDDAAIRAEIDTAIQATLRYGFGRNQSLCHGDLGNLDLLLEASRVLGDVELAARTKSVAGSILASIEERGWLCGVPLGVEVPGLMTGLAGIGYELLRLAEPIRVPSVLVFDPPISPFGR
jgi:type 2 lantibiotic biosynthesis protein LanM